jgi:hypothetical protein
MLSFLHVAECDGWHHIVTGDESWFSWIHHHIACGLCREITWSQNRNLIFRAKMHVYDHVEPKRLLCCRQIPKWYQNEQWSFWEKFVHSIWTSDLSSRKGAASEITCGLSRQLFSSHKSAFNILIRRRWHAPHATPNLFTWFSPSYFYFFSAMKKLEQIQVADEDQFFEFV